MGLLSWLASYKPNYIDADGVIQQFEPPSTARQTLGCMFGAFTLFLGDRPEVITPRARIAVDIRLRGGAAYRVAGKIKTTRMLSPGDRVDLAVDPKDFTRVRVSSGGELVGFIEEGQRSAVPSEGAGRL